MNRALLWQQLRIYVTDAVALDLLSQFLHYNVEWGGLFHSPPKGIPRSSSLSPLLAAFHLYSIDEDFAKQPNLYYARYMDDFIILTKSRWHLRRAVRRLNCHFTAFHFEQHPNKTFIGKIDKGFDWMGFCFTHNGCTKIAPRALNNHLLKLRRLYEQIRKLPTLQQAIRMTSYIIRWHRWKDNVLLELDVTLLSQPSVASLSKNLS
ncbi:reverse transcriptase domain-containing protein [Vibrio navarrensis]|uniref:reverse transcriptase domain-containing protein n=1 Tax=Vibrio navarrensis TaxID=29495 RepID=UPI003B97F3F1